MPLPTNITPKKLSSIFPNIRKLGIPQNQSEVQNYGTVLERVLASYGMELVKAIQDSAIAENNYTQTPDGSGLIQGTRYTIQDKESSVEMSLYMEDYYSYVDEGTSGIKQTRNGKSRRVGSFPPPKSFERYVITKTGLKAAMLSRHTELKSLSAIQQVKSLAYILARNSYLYGQKGSNFYSKVVNQQNMDELKTELTAITGKLITIDIKKYGNNS